MKYNTYFYKESNDYKIITSYKKSINGLLKDIIPRHEVECNKYTDTLKKDATLSKSSEYVDSLSNNVFNATYYCAYNIAALKQLLKHNGLFVVGNKKQMYLKLYVYKEKMLKSVVKIQSIFRKKLINVYLSSLNVKNIQNSANDTDFYTLEKLTNMYKYDCFCYENNNIYYTYNQYSFKVLIDQCRKNNNKLKLINPYNRSVISNRLLLLFNKVVRIRNIYKIQYDIMHDNSQIYQSNTGNIAYYYTVNHDYSAEEVSKLAREVFYNVDYIAEYYNTKPSWFLNLCDKELLKLARKLEKHRLNVKRNPFALALSHEQEYYITNAANLSSSFTTSTDLKYKLLLIMYNMYNECITSRQKIDGCLFILDSLCSISTNARIGIYYN